MAYDLIGDLVSETWGSGETNFSEGFDMSDYGSTSLTLNPSEFSMLGEDQESTSAVDPGTGAGWWDTAMQGIGSFGKSAMDSLSRAFINKTVTQSPTSISVEADSNNSDFWSSLGSGLLAGTVNWFTQTPVGQEIKEQQIKAEVDSGILGLVKSPITWLVIVGGIIILFVLLKKK